MAKATPIKLILEYGDGTRREATFDSLPGTLQFDLLRQRFLLDPDAAVEEAEGKFVLLEWKDGWKEVYEVGPEYEAIGRYFDLAREEEIGRLSLKAADGYPELLEIVRRPGEVVRIAFGQSFTLAKGDLKREGKKKEQFYKLAASGEAFAAEVAALRKLAGDEGIDLGKGMDLRGEELGQWLDGLRHKLGIVAGQRQQDVLDFAGYLVREAHKG
jgi:hypothetical protein